MKKILSFTLMLLMMLSLCVSVSAQESSIYEDKVYELLQLDYPREEHCYEECFFYYGEDSTADEATPDYVLVLVHYALVSDIQVQSHIGKYIVSTGPYSPYLHGYHFYLPEEHRILALEEAITSELAGVEEGLKSIPYSVALAGDCDGDFALTIKDATCIQKRIAGLESPHHVLGDYNHLVYDFNGDGERNIKDATAIQKYIAGLEY